MRVLVTGHEGYLGSVVVPMLVAGGHDVVGRDTGFFSHGTLGPPPEDGKSFRMDVRDIRPEHCDGILRGDLVVNELVGRAVLTGEVLLRSDGLAWRPLVHVEDVGAAVRTLLEAPAGLVRARTYHVGRSDGNHLLRDVARTVVEEVPGSRVRFAAGAAAGSHDYRICCRRIETEIPGFRPRWTLRAGIGQLAEAYRRHRLVIDDLTGPRHQRVPGLRALRQAGRIDRDLRWVTR